MKKYKNKIKKYLKDPEEKNFIINVLMAFGVKGLSLLISVFATPLYIRYFNNNAVLGIWYTILSLLTWVSVADLGLGNGLRNKLTTVLAESKFGLAKKYISSTYAALFCIMMPLAIIGSIIIFKADLNSFFGVTNEEINRSALNCGVSILFIGITISFIIKPINNIIYALQKSSINNFISLCTSVIPLAYIIVSAPADSGTNFLRLSIIHVIAIEIPLIIATIIVFKGSIIQKCLPGLKYIELSVAKEMMGFGLQFFGAQIFFMMIMSTNELIISRLYNSAYVVQYNVYYKLFTLAGSIFTLALTPLWSKITRDLTLKKYKTIKNTLSVLYLFSGLAMLANFILVIALQRVLDIWLGSNTFEVDYVTAIIFAFFGGSYIFNTALTTVANGLGKMKSQIVIYSIGALFKLPVILLVRKFTDNWNVVTLYNAIVLTIFCVAEIMILKRMICAWEKNSQ